MEFLDEAVEPVQALVQEIAEHQGQLEGVKVERHPQLPGYGIFASKALAADTAVVSIPLSQCITVDRIVQYPPFAEVFQACPGLLEYPDEVLSLGLMYGMLEAKRSRQCPWRERESETR